MKRENDVESAAVVVVGGGEKGTKEMEEKRNFFLVKINNDTNDGNSERVESGDGYSRFIFGVN